MDVIHNGTVAGITGRKVTVSIGIARILDNVHGMPDKLVRLADMAMYVAKQKGRNRIALS